VTHRAKSPERLAEKLRRRQQEENKDYKTVQNIYDDIIDLPAFALPSTFLAIHRTSTIAKEQEARSS